MCSLIHLRTEDSRYRPWARQVLTTEGFEHGLTEYPRKPGGYLLWPAVAARQAALRGPVLRLLLAQTPCCIFEHNVFFQQTVLLGNWQHQGTATRNNQYHNQFSSNIAVSIRSYGGLDHRGHVYSDEKHVLQAAGNR